VDFFLKFKNMQENQDMAYIPLHTFKGKGKIEEGR
jgi:hypothetical protein